MKIDFSKFKNLDLKDINLKELKNRKELLILLGIVLFVIAILLIGNSLWSKNCEAREKLEKLKDQYEAVNKAGSVEVLSSKVETMRENLENNEGSTEPITKMEIIEILDKMQQDLGISWNKKTRVISDATKVDKVKGLFKFKVTVPDFVADYEDAKAIMEYIQKLDRKVSVESFSVKKNPLTGELRSSMVLNFYMRDEEGNA